MERPWSSSRSFPCESVAGTAFFTVIERPSIVRGMLRSKSAAVTLSIRISRPSTSRAKRPSSPSMARSSAGGLFIVGFTQDFEVGRRVLMGRDLVLGRLESREVGHGAHGPAQGGEIGDRAELRRPEEGLEVLAE